MIVQPAPLEPPALPRIITVHGPAGGVGKSLVALHLSYLYAHKGCTTVLVDLAQYGAAIPWLRIPRGTGGGVSALIAALGEGPLPGDRLDSALVPAPGAGGRLRVVPSSGPAKMDQIHTAQAESLLRLLAGSAQVVVVDTGSELTDRVIGALVASNRIALTLTPHAVPGWQALECLDILRSAGIGRERLGLILNRVRPGGRYAPADFEQVLGLPVLGIIPEAPDLHATAEGSGPPDPGGRGPGVRALRRLAHALVPIFTPGELSPPWPWSR